MNDKDEIQRLRAENAELKATLLKLADQAESTLMDVEGEWGPERTFVKMVADQDENALLIAKARTLAAPHN